MPIMKEKLDVNVKDKSETGKLGVKLLEFLRDLRTSVRNDDSAREIWKQKMIVANNQRLGVKRWKSPIYNGAPDIPLPETDKLIKKAVPTLVMSAFAPKKKCVVGIEQGVQDTPEMIQQSKEAEAGMNMVLNSNRTDWFRKLCLAADNGKQYGHAIFRVIEDFCSRIVHKVLDLEEYDENLIEELKSASNDELKTFLAERYGFDLEDEDDKETVKDIIKQFRSGETVIEFDTEEIYSYPNVEIPLPTKIIVPPYTTDINKAQRITYEYFLSKEQLEEKIDKGIFLKHDLDGIRKSISTGIGVDNLEHIKSRNEGIEDNQSDKELFRIHETCCWYKPEGQKRASKHVFTFFADMPTTEGKEEESLLQRISFPFEFEGWNYEKWDNEIKDARYHASRGTPEQIRAYQETMERALNNMLIRDEQNNMPIWEVQENSELMDAHLRIGPGDKLGVKQIGAEIKKLNEVNNVDMSSERILQLLKAYTEEYAGSNDQLFRNATNKGGGKTLGEIQEGIRQSSGPSNLDVLHFNEVLSRVYFKMAMIMKERLGQSIYINGMTVTRESYNFPMEVKSNGSLEVSDKDLATQKAFMRMQVLNPADNPSVVTIQTPDDLYNTVYDWLEKDGIKDPDQFITDPKEIMKDKSAQMQVQLQQMQQQLQAGAQQNAELQKTSGKVSQKIGQDVAKAQGTLEAIGEAGAESAGRKEKKG